MTKKKKPEPIVEWFCDDTAAPMKVQLKHDPVKDAKIMRAAWDIHRKILEKAKKASH